MYRSIGYGAVSLSVLAMLVVTARQAQTQVMGTLPAFVRVQTTTPGTAQSGHSNITGTAIAGQFVGGGAGVTGVNANLLDGLDSTAFLQGVPNPLSLSGSSTSAIISGTNSNAGASAAAVKGVSTSVAGATNAVSGTSMSSAGRGVFGEATSASGVNYGGRFESDSVSGRGLYGLVSATTGTTYGGKFECLSDEGYGVYASTAGLYGVYGVSDNVNGYGVFGKSTSQGGQFEGDPGFGVGAWGLGRTGLAGHSESTTGMGVYGYVSTATGTNYGGYFDSDSANGRGVYGIASALGATDTPYGVRGQASTATNGFGLYAVGDSGATGLKTFRIDHPQDPENKYLLHYSTESPFPQNFYSGNVVTDAQGKAWVTLPEYFHEINANFKYQLTVVDDGESNQFVQVKVARKIANGRFMVMTSSPRVEVSWRVEADRDDLRVKARRPLDVVEKVGIEKGKVQHPEYYGLPASRGMDFVPEKAKDRLNTLRP